MKISEIKLENIIVDELFQPRQNIPCWKQLTESIKAVGVLDPVKVTQRGDGFVLVDGRRRFEAAKDAGLDALPAIIFEDDAMLNRLKAITANVQRDNLYIFEKEKAIQQVLFDYEQIDAAVLAGAVGIKTEKAEKAKKGAHVFAGRALPQDKDGNECQVSIDSMMLMAELEDRPELIDAALENLKTTGSYGDRLKRVLEEQLEVKNAEMFYEKVKDQVAQAGATWVNHWNWSMYSRSVPNVEGMLAEDNPCGCDGFIAAYQYGDIIWGCSKKENHQVEDEQAKERARINNERFAIKADLKANKELRLETIEKGIAGMGKRSRFYDPSFDLFLGLIPFINYDEYTLTDAEGSVGVFADYKLEDCHLRRAADMIRFIASFIEREIIKDIDVFHQCYRYQLEKTKFYAENRAVIRYYTRLSELGYEQTESDEKVLAYCRENLKAWEAAKNE